MLIYNFLWITLGVICVCTDVNADIDTKSVWHMLTYLFVRICMRTCTPNVDWIGFPLKIA